MGKYDFFFFSPVLIISAFVPEKLIPEHVRPRKQALQTTQFVFVLSFVPPKNFAVISSQREQVYQAYFVKAASYCPRNSGGTNKQTAGLVHFTALQKDSFFLHALE